jgi:hypothetical protein
MGKGQKFTTTPKVIDPEVSPMTLMEAIDAPGSIVEANEMPRAKTWLQSVDMAP